MCLIAVFVILPFESFETLSRQFYGDEVPTSGHFKNLKETVSVVVAL
jgi:hypothetical protein